MYSTSSPDDTDTVLRAIKQICDIFLFDFSFEINRFCQHLKKKTLSEELLKEAMKTFDMKVAGACVGQHELCGTMKQRRADTGSESMRGAAREIDHERKHNAGPCLYLSNAPFVRLLRV